MGSQAAYSKLVTVSPSAATGDDGDGDHTRTTNPTVGAARAKEMIKSSSQYQRFHTPNASHDDEVKTILPGDVAAIARVRPPSTNATGANTTSPSSSSCTSMAEEMRGLRRRNEYLQSCLDELAAASASTDGSGATRTCSRSPSPPKLTHPRRDSQSSSDNGHGSGHGSDNGGRHERTQLVELARPALSYDGSGATSTCNTSSSSSSRARSPSPPKVTRQRQRSAQRSARSPSRLPLHRTRDRIGSNGYANVDVDVDANVVANVDADVDVDVDVEVPNGSNSGDVVEGNGATCDVSSEASSSVSLGNQPLNTSIDNASTFQQSRPFLESFKDRAGWLVGLLLLQSCSSFIIAKNESFLERHMVIVQFLTMLVGAGGNAGNQASVRVIRGLATGTLIGRDPITGQDKIQGFLKQELEMAAALSAALGGAGLFRAAVFRIPIPETIAIVTSLCAIVSVSIGIGSTLPLGMRKMGIDPAHSSTTIQVLMDILGVLITVGVSTLVLEKLYGIDETDSGAGDAAEGGE